MTNLPFLILIAFVCFVVGLAAGALILMLTNRRGETPAEKTPKAAPAPNPNKLVELQRDPASGRLMVEVEGRVLSSVQSLNGEQRGRLQKIARDWLEWLGAPPVEAPAAPQPAARPAAPMEPPIPRPAGIRATMTSPSAPSAPPAPEASIEALLREEPVQPVPPTIFPAPVKKADLPRPPTSIVEQIDQVLQEQISGTPLASKAIRLTDGGNQGVIVWIGVQRYVGVDAVTDPEIQRAIRAAVAEWERRSEK